MNFCRKILAAGMAAVMLAGVSMAEARQHGGVEPGAEANVEVRQNSGVEARTGTVKTAGADNEVSVRPVSGDEQVVELAVNMKVDGLHPKYSNRVPESWHPLEEVDWQVKNQDSPQLLKRWPVTVEDGGGTLLFSDSPEYVEQDGILYSDVVTGAGRIFYYHLNNTRQNKKIAVVLENEGKYTAILNVSREALSAPSDNYLWVGKTTQQAYMESKVNRNVFVFPNRKAILSNKMTETIVRPGQLVNGIYDFTADGPVRLSVIMYPAGANPIEFMKKAKVLPKDEHRLRGTYKGMNRIIRAEKVYNPQQDGAVFIPLADNDRDVYRYGIDATDGSETQNYGNYGIMYELQVPVKGTGDVQYILQPLGGVYAGAMSVQDMADRQKFMLSVPQNQLYFGNVRIDDFTSHRFPPTEDTDYIYFSSELASLGSYGAEQKLRFEFSPPGASNLPVNFILMPATQAQGLAYKWQKR